MSPHEEEDFELVLGNRQLFFLAVVLFGVFFSIGYTVGYSRGSDGEDTVTSAAADATTADTSAVNPSLANESPEVRPTRHTDAGESSTPAADQPPAEAAASQPKSESPAGAAPEQSAAAPTKSPDPAIVARNAEPPPPDRPAAKPSTESRSRTPERAAAQPAAKTSAASVSGRSSAPEPPRAEPTPTVAVPEIVRGSVYLQVAASTEAGPARELLLKFKSRGHPVALDNLEPPWFRILVGPFPTTEAAAQYQLKLKAENSDSFIRKF